MNETIAQPNKNQNGGPRPGAGRPKGSSNKLRVTDFFNGEERDRLIQQAKDLTIDSNGKPDKDMVKFLWEQLFGKATQKMEHGGVDGAALIFKLTQDVAGKYTDTNNSTDGDSKE